jgi:hypothetical protein
MEKRLKSEGMKQVFEFEITADNEEVIDIQLNG